MFFFVQFAFALAPRLANMPFRLILEDTKGMTPDIYRTYDSWIMVQESAYNIKSQKQDCTLSGHVLVAQPIDTMTELRAKAKPLSLLEEDINISEMLAIQQPICFTDVMEMFESSVPCFKCALSGSPSSHAYAVRIEDTCIWLLVSNYMNLLKCNSCATRINRLEFNQIQTGFLKILYNHYR